MSAPTFVKAGATFMDGERPQEYRTRLWREWEHGAGSLCLTMLNPSTADANVLDPTVRRGVGFAVRWGFARLDVANLFGLRSTDPSALRKHKDPVGQIDVALVAYAAEATMVVCAWGIHGRIGGRDARVIELFQKAGIEMWCFGINDDGTPVHPLYLPNDQPLIKFPAPPTPENKPEALAAWFRAGGDPALDARVQAEQARFIRGTARTPPRGLMSMMEDRKP
jgi:hypothetical protein